MITLRYFPNHDEYGNPDSFRKMFAKIDGWYTGEDEDPYALFIVARSETDEGQSSR